MDAHRQRAGFLRRPAQTGPRRPVSRHRGRIRHRTLPRLECLEDLVLLSTNPIVVENALAGTPRSQWNIVSGAGNANLQGFATDISVNQGQTISFKINDKNQGAYRIDIYRMGYYQGNGARLVTTIPSSQAAQIVQPAPISDPTTGEVDAGNWSVAASWAVPTTATSGIYFANLVPSNTAEVASQIVFIVRNDAGTSQILFQTSDSTWQAYNTWGAGSTWGGNSTGGNSLYQGSFAGTANSQTAGRAYAVSYNRPLTIDGVYGGYGTYNSVWHGEYPMVYWLEQNGYDVSYFTDVDAARSGSLILNHQVYMDCGHDEYVSGPQRSSIETALAHGVNLALMSGNEIYWKTRWANSLDGSATPNRTLVCYKESTDNQVLDPQDPPTWTGTWRDLRFSPPADGGRPENALIGNLYMDDRTNVDLGIPLQVPAADANLWFWKNTAVANLQAGQVATLGQYVVGYEVNEDLDNGFRPAGLIDMSSTTFSSTSRVVVPWGTVVGSGIGTHSLTLYRAASGALVFGAGTVQWDWGLGYNNWGPSGEGVTEAPDASIEQAMVNLLANMGSQPGTLQSGLVAATASTDTTPPTSTITSPAAGASIQSGSTITITGTATDAGGGVVGGVEVSTDGGVTWHPATGRANWSYTWSPNGIGSVTLKTRAVDDSGHLEAPSAGTTVTVVGPISIWSNSATPEVATDGDSSSTEVGVKIRSDVSAYILGLRFYKGSTNTGTHVGSLWSSTGTLLARATFTNETASGWQQVLFASPVPISANTTYVASYHAPNGHYAEDDFSFASSGVSNGPLHALAAGVDGPDGVYAYGSTSLFPTNNYESANYWVDVVYNTTATDTTPPTVTAETPAPNATGVATSATVTATFSESIQPSTLSFVLKDSGGNVVPASVTYTDPNLTATLTPSSPLANSTTYTATVSGAEDIAGNPLASPVTWSFTTSAPLGPGPYSIWPSMAAPVTADDPDTSSTEVGVKFRSDAGGYITGLRFYKGSANTGTHVGSLWSSTGTMLAQATFTGETASGWQQVSFASPVAIQSNTTYVASYHAPNGRYAEDDNFFANSGVDNAPLHALAAGVDGPDGVYSYSSSSSFPTNNYLSANYWVDVVFQTTLTDTTPPTAPTNLAAAVSGTTASLSWTASTDNGGVTGYNVYRSTTSGFTPSGSNQIGTATATSYTDSGLAAGTYYYLVTAHDAAGNNSSPSNQATATVTADTTPPTVALTAPASGATVSGTVTVSANASDNVAVAYVQFTLDGQNLGARVTTAPYAMSWNTTTAANGSHTVGAIAYDTSGNQASAATVTVTVSNTGPPGLVASYSLDEGSGTTVNDSSGNNNTGTAANASWVTGKYGKALKFTGATNSMATIADAASLDLTSGMTLEAWVNPTSLNTNWNAAISKDHVNSSNDISYALYAAAGSNRRPAVHILVGGTDYAAQGTSVLSLNTWTFLAATYDGTTLRMYVNGTQVATKTIKGSITTTADPLHIGGDWSGEMFSGSIDNVRIYAAALSAAQLTTDMNAAISGGQSPAAVTAPSTATSRLVAALPSNDGTGSTLYDSSGNSSAGTVVRATWAAGENGSTPRLPGATTSMVTMTTVAPLVPTTGPALVTWVDQIALASLGDEGDGVITTNFHVSIRRPKSSTKEIISHAL